METNRIPYNKGWRFALTADRSALNADFEDREWRQVELPHDWQIENPRSEFACREQGYFPREQVGIYRLKFTVPEEWRGKTVRILFDGIQHFSEVYLNGQKVGERPYGYVPVLCDLTQKLNYSGDNVLALWVDNRDPSGGAWTSNGGDRWYSGAGIYRKVWLLVQDPTHIVHDGIRVAAVPINHGPNGDVPDVAGIRCDRASVSLRVESEGDLRDTALRVEIFDPVGNCVYSSESEALGENTLCFMLLKPLLWTPENPTLYRAVFQLTRDGNVIDEHLVRFGIRSAEFDSEDGFVLNGVKTKLWGVNLHHDGGCVGAAVPIEVWRRRLKALKTLGVNTLRAAHNPMAEEVYDLCDEMGFLVVDELYDKWDQGGIYYNAFFDAWYERDLESMIRRSANHPCVILWSVGNEVRGQFTERYFECLKELTDACRRLDPTRAVTAALISFVLPDYNDTTPLGRKLEIARRYAEYVDVFSGNYMEHFYERLRESGMRKPILGTEVRMYYRHDSRYPDHVSVRCESPYAIVKKHDWVCGALVWAGVDYLGESPFWPLRGWTGDLLDSTGDVKLRAYYCAAQWKQDPILKLAVYDESEPWDGARGMWGFPQMRRHWKYSQFEKVMHVAAMTNCDTVKLYQNTQVVRIGRLCDFEDGMVHFYLPYIPGKLRAEGYRGGVLVCEDAIYSDHEASTLVVQADKTTLPADGQSVAFLDVALEDSHGLRYTLEDRPVIWSADGAVRILADNGNAWSDFPVGTASVQLHRGHAMLMVISPCEPATVRISIEVQGFDTRSIDFTFI